MVITLARVEAAYDLLAKYKGQRNDFPVMVSVVRHGD